MSNMYVISSALLSISIVTRCSTTGFNNDSSKESMVLKPIDKKENNKNLYDSIVETAHKVLLSTNRGRVLELGWDEGKDNCYILSKFSKEEQEGFVQKGITRLENIAKALQLGNDVRGQASGLLSCYYLEKNDFKNCLKWAFYGVSLGSYSCAEVLYSCYTTGQGTVHDYEEACKWKFIGSALGSELCRKQILEDKKRSHGNQEFAKKLDEGNRRAKEWERDHPDLFVSFE